MEFNAKRVLIYRLGSLGDTIVALPCFHLIRRAFWQAERFVFTAMPAKEKAPAISAVLGASGLVNGYIIYSYRIFAVQGLFQLRKKIREWKPDILVYLPGQRGYLRVIRDALFFKSCGIKKIIGIPYSRSLQRNRLLANKLYYEHEAVRLARCISILGDARLEEPSSWDLLLSPQEYQDAEGVLKGWSARNRFIACGIGTNVEIKDWGNQNWQALLRQLSPRYIDYGLVLMGSDADFSYSEELCKIWAGPALNLCGKVSPRIASAIIKHAIIFLGHDSGPMHLAAAAGIPCVAVFSARHEPGIWFPYGASHRIIYHKTECFGCRLDVCKKYNKKCINSITVNEVFDVVCQVVDRLNR